jgi:5-methylcytosine-specific restriction endonuclease McrA
LAPAVTVDHIVPRFEGGGEEGNLMSLCKKCHDKKTAEEGHRAWAKKKARIARQFDFSDTHPSSY